MRKLFIFLGIILMGFAVLVFVERGFFASAFFGAHVLGNIPWDRPDAVKVGKVIVIVSGLFIFGMVMAIIGLLHRETR